MVNASNNTLAAEYSYDAWGRLRNNTTWVTYAPESEPTLMIAGRGFTGHEHLPWFRLINMNGRVYDPLTGQLLSADNYIQSPAYTQSYNRYSYCLNNPLKYTDPSGNIFKKRDYEPWEPGPIPYLPGSSKNDDLYGAFINSMHESGNYRMSLTMFAMMYNTIDVSGTPGTGQKVTIEYYTGRYAQIDPGTHEDGPYCIVYRETATYTYYIPAESDASRRAQAAGGGDASKPSTILKATSSGLGLYKNIVTLDQSANPNFALGLSIFNTGLKGFMVYQQYNNGKINPVDATSVTIGSIGIAAKVLTLLKAGGKVAPFISTTAGYFGTALTIWSMWSIPYKSMDDLRFAPLYYDSNGERVWDTGPTDAEIFNDF